MGITHLQQPEPLSQPESAESPHAGTRRPPRSVPGSGWALLPGQGGASSHLEEPGEPLVGNFPLLREARPVPLAALPKAERGLPPPRGASGLQGPGWAEQGQGGQAGVAREEERMDRFRSARSPAGRNRRQE